MVPYRRIELGDARGTHLELVVGIAVVDTQPAERIGGGALESGAARREGTRQVDRGELADRTAEVARAEPDEVTPAGEHEDAVAAAAAVLFEHDDLAAAPGH